MKKFLGLSFALFAFGFSSSATAQGILNQTISPEQLVNEFCQEAQESGIQSDEEIADMVRTYIAELNNPTMDQIIALSQIAVKVENGKSLKKACK